jgi:hypothetical protein
MADGLSRVARRAAGYRLEAYATLISGLSSDDFKVTLAASPRNASQRRGSAM